MMRHFRFIESFVQAPPAQQHAEWSLLSEMLTNVAIPKMYRRMMYRQLVSALPQKEWAERLSVIDGIQQLEQLE